VKVGLVVVCQSRSAMRYWPRRSLLSVPHRRKLHWGSVLSGEVVSRQELCSHEPVARLRVRSKCLMSVEAAAEDEENVEALGRAVGWATDHWLCHDSMLLRRSMLVEVRRPLS
jgi:hypothetical protein